MNALREYLKIVYGSLTASNWRDPQVAWIRISYLIEELIRSFLDALKRSIHL